MMKNQVLKACAIGLIFALLSGCGGGGGGGTTTFSTPNYTTTLKVDGTVQAGFPLASGSTVAVNYTSGQLLEVESTKAVSYTVGENTTNHPAYGNVTFLDGNANTQFYRIIASSDTVMTIQVYPTDSLPISQSNPYDRAKEILITINVKS